MSNTTTIELPIGGMDCMECTRNVRQAVLGVSGVQKAEVYLVSEKAVIEVESDRFDINALEQAVVEAGYRVGTSNGKPLELADQLMIGRSVRRLTAGLFAIVLLIVVVGELLGLFETVTGFIPWWIGLILVILAGFPIFRSVINAAIHGRVLSHTLMSLGVVAALAVGQWITALIIVFFMRVGNYVEQFTADQARQAIKRLSDSSPHIARVIRNGEIVEVTVEELNIGDIVVVRPGEKIPVDGEVISGHATIDQSTITGESMPHEVGPGAHVYAATMAQLGSLRVKAMQVGADSTFGQIIRLVEEAESQRSDVQRLADKFSVYFLPVVLIVAILTYIISRDVMAVAAVLVVACSCSIAMATPIAVLASIGAAAKSGLLVKGGKYLEALAQADVLLLDKTGTLTLGQPQVSKIISLNGMTNAEMLHLAASAERYSEHPIAAAIRLEATSNGIELSEPGQFSAVPGLGVRALVGEKRITVGSYKLIPGHDASPVVEQIPEAKTRIFVGADDLLVGVIAVSDTLRSEVPAALEQIQALGLIRIELLTGDNFEVTSELASNLGISFRSDLLPKDKIEAVRHYQRQGLKVVMIGDGVNDAPALAQADVGIAMGAAGSDIALEAADIALMRDDWYLVPEILRISRRTMSVVKMNLGLTGIYNLVGLSLAALGLLPPILAAAAQSLPDLGILANSSRLLRQ